MPGNDENIAINSGNMKLSSQERIADNMDAIADYSRWALKGWY